MPKRKVMFVEDDPSVLELELQVARKLGHEVIAASDGLKALDLIRKERPDAVVLDVTLPGCDGFSLARALRGDAATRHLPIAFVTGHSDCGFSHGAAMYLSKPFSIRALQLLVESLLTTRRRTPKAPQKLTSPAEIPPSPSQRSVEYA